MQIRVHELAKELKISTMALRKHLTDLNVIVKSHMSLVDEEVADLIRRKYNEQMDAEKRAEKERKRVMEMRQAAKTAKAEPAPEAPEEVAEEAPAKPAKEKKSRKKAEKEPEPLPETPETTEPEQEEEALEAPIQPESMFRPPGKHPSTALSFLTPKPPLFSPGASRRAPNPPRSDMKKKAKPGPGWNPESGLKNHAGSRNLWSLFLQSAL